jgi:AAA+ ATPase superfamily predicted ATPase
MRRHVRYDLEDALLRFWFRFVFPNESSIQQMGPKRAFRERIRPDLDAYAGTCFERLCREALPRIYEREGVSAAFQVGEYWDKTAQIDIVGLRDDGWTDLGECKWGSVRSSSGVLADLRARASRFPNPRGATIGHRLFLHRCARMALPPERRGDPVRWHSLDDLYA